MFKVGRNQTSVELYITLLIIFLLMSLGITRMYPFVDDARETQQLYNAQIIYTVAQALEISTNELILSPRILQVGAEKKTLLAHLNLRVQNVKIAEKNSLNPLIWGITDDLIITAPDGTKYKEGEKIENFEKIKK